MRIHSNTLTVQDLYTAARLAGADLDYTSHGSRSRHHAFEVRLTGNSHRRPNFWHKDPDPSVYAATWDQWGVFLGYLYAVDPDLITPYYVNPSDFDYKTDWRFDLPGFKVIQDISDFSERSTFVHNYRSTLIPFPLDHDHYWTPTGTPREFECKCGAIRRS